MTGTLSSVIFNQNDLRNYIVSKIVIAGRREMSFGLDKLAPKILNKDKVVWMVAIDSRQRFGHVSVAGDFDERC